MRHLFKDAYTRVTSKSPKQMIKTREDKIMVYVKVSYAIEWNFDLFIVNKRILANT